MLPKIASVFIVGFWIVMTTMLIRLEHDPDKSNLLSVPPSHVLKLMFLHEQTSELNIMENGKPVGNLILHPKLDPDANERTLIFSGGVSFLPPGGAKRQRLSWDGSLVMDRTYTLRKFLLATGLQDSPYRVYIAIDPAANRMEYEVRQGGRSLGRSSTTLDSEGLVTLLKDDLGVDPLLLQSIPRSVAAPVITAKQTELKIHKEKVVAYLLTVQQGDIVMAEIYVSQLGQILVAKTVTNYTLSSEDLSP